LCTATAGPIPSAGPWSIQVTTASPVPAGTNAIFHVKVIGKPPPCGGCQGPYGIGCYVDWQEPNQGVVYQLGKLILISGDDTTATQTYQSERKIGTPGAWHWTVTCSDRNGTASSHRSDEGFVTVLAPPSPTPPA
jgi:hypothetical protein